jgi:alkaline phosphatase
MRFLLLLTLGCTLSACTLTAQTTHEAVRPKNVILLISDGCGPASFTMARDYRRDVLRLGPTLHIDSLLVGAVRTFATNSRVTDSAAGATAFACGIKTYNGAIAVDTLQQPVATLIEAAEARGMATGLVATSRITHATPAAFAAHVASRGDEAGIADQMLRQGIDVLMGGGRTFFVPTEAGGSRRDGRDLRREAAGQGYQVVEDRTAFDGPVRTPVLALLAHDHLAYEIDRDAAREPSLAEMTTRALDLLDDDPDGFFLMVEGSRIDHAGHANDLGGHLHDILAYDAAIAAAVQFARQDRETLVVSVSDHETGGLSLGRNVDRRGVYAWQPAVLARLTQSDEAVTPLLKAGADWQAVIQAATGIDDWTDAEKAQVAEAQAANFPPGALRAMHEMVGVRAVVGWTSDGHTAVDVNLYAFGPGRDAFIGHHDNTHVGQTLARLLGLDLAAMTTRLRQ